MRIGAFVQARMSSSRLPGKVLMPLCGQPLLDYVVQRLERVRGLDFFVVVTSEEASDEPVREHCANRGIQCFSGPLDDVAGRFVAALEVHPCDGILRYCADSPLVDVALMDLAVAEFASGNWDVVTNVFPRTFPPGQSVEVVSASLLAEAHEHMSPYECEHCTSYCYNFSEQFRIKNLTTDQPADYERICVDTPEDFRLLERVLSGMDRPHWEYGWRDLAPLLSGAGGVR